MKDKTSIPISKQPISSSSRVLKRSVTTVDRKIHLEPTLYIAAGTSSGQTLRRIKQLQAQVIDDIPIHRYLWVDTDTISR